MEGALADEGGTRCPVRHASPCAARRSTHRHGRRHGTRRTREYGGSARTGSPRARRHGIDVGRPVQSDGQRVRRAAPTACSESGISIGPPIRRAAAGSRRADQHRRIQPAAPRVARQVQTERPSLRLDGTAAKRRMHMVAAVLVGFRRWTTARDGSSRRRSAIWLMDWRELRAALDSRTTACLPDEERRRYRGEHRGALAHSINAKA